MMKHCATDLRSKLETSKKCPSMMRGGIGQIPHRKKNDKGFTLVELIVVIVILAILAALLIPSLLKWIDKAKEEQYGLEARNVYLATEAYIAEQYAAGKGAPGNSDYNDITTDASEYIKNLSGVDVSKIEIKTDGQTAVNKAPTTEEWKVVGLKITFTSSDKKTITGEMAPNERWTFTVGSSTP